MIDSARPIPRVEADTGGWVAAAASELIAPGVVPQTKAQRVVASARNCVTESTGVNRDSRSLHRSKSAKRFTFFRGRVTSTHDARPDGCLEIEAEASARHVTGRVTLTAARVSGGVVPACYLFDTCQYHFTGS